MEIWQVLLSSAVAVAIVTAIADIIKSKINRKWKKQDDAAAKESEEITRLDRIEKKLDAHIIEDDRRNADLYRTRILRFNNELLLDVQHSREMFVDVLADIDEYEDFYTKHPEYPNNRTVSAVHNIKRVYEDCMRKHNFLGE